MILTPFQALALGLTSALMFAVLGGSLIAWSKCIAGYLNGSKADRVATSPQATVGLIDLLVTLLVLGLLFSLAAMSWRASGLRVERTAAQTNPPSSLPDSNQPTEDPTVATALPSDPLPSDPLPEPPSKSPSPQPAGFSQSQFIFSGFAMTAQLLCVGLVTFFVAGRTGCSMKKLGWRTDQWKGDLRAGFQCFLMMTPFILVINALLQKVTQTPYEHPVQEMIKQYPWLLGIAFWQASIVAPISEEFGFRVLLIGWFESIHFGKNKIHAFMVGASEPITSQAIGQEEGESAPQALGANPTEPGLPTRYQAPWWPTLVSGTLFGLAHFSYGVSWVSLVVFGIVLGRVYQHRQSILPIIAVHLLFNTANLILLGLSLFIPR